MRLSMSLSVTTAIVASYPAHAAQSAAVMPAADAMAPVAAPDAANAAGSDDRGDTIVVFGKGQTKQVQELRNKDIAVLASGTSPLKALEKLPSVNFQSADPFGNYEWSARITIRGFNQNQLGFTLDGIPLGDMTYGNNNGLHVSRAIIAENIGLTRMSQGAGAITTNSTNSLGGTLEFFSVDPADVLGADVSASYGSDNMMRGFGRVAIGTRDGARAYVAAQYHKTDKWKGDGEQRTAMVNAKAILPVGFGDLDGYLSYSDRAEQDYQDLSLGMISRLGYDWDNFGPSGYQQAILVADIGANRGDTGTTPLNPAAGTVYPAPITSIDDAYYDASGLRKDTLGAVGFTSRLNGPVQIKLKGYYHENDGQGTWGTPYVNSPTGVPMAVRTTEYDLKRSGAFGSVSYDMGNNDLVVGAWYENNDFDQARRFYAYLNRTTPGRDHLEFMRDPFFTQWEISFNTQTFQYYVDDTLKLGDTSINLGWKGFSVRNKAEPIVLGGRTIGELKTVDWFQPHIGINQKLGSNMEAFAGFTQATRAFVSSTTAGPFSSTQAGFNAIKPLLKPEQSNTFETGLRYSTPMINAVLSAYYVDFRNRLLTIPTSVGIVGAANALQNVGSVRSLGVEAAVDARLGHGWSLFGSYSYNDASYRDNVVITANGTTTVIPTDGKTVVDTPKHLIHAEIAYDNDGFFGRLGANYMSKRFFTYLNDQSVPGRVLVDATLGYRFNAGLRKPIEIQLNATNLLDKRYVSTIGSNGFGNSGDNQTLLAGSPRAVFATLKAGF